MATAPSQHRDQKSGTDWRAQLGSRLVSADEAVSHIKSGDRVCLSSQNLKPDVLVVKPTEDRYRRDTADLVRPAKIWSIFVQ